MRSTYSTHRSTADLLFPLILATVVMLLPFSIAWSFDLSEIDLGPMEVYPGDPLCAYGSETFDPEAEAHGSWSEKKTTDRFVVVLNCRGVLDQETGMVWQRYPSAAKLNWYDARTHCADASIGRKKGWRLATIHEINSLADPSAGTPEFPSIHPFRFPSAFGDPGQPSEGPYWSATTKENFTGDAWVLNFHSGVVTGLNKTFGGLSWCARAGHAGPDAY